MPNDEISSHLFNCRDEINVYLDYLLSQRLKDLSSPTLIEAMRYSLLSHGKRLRPFLIRSSCQLFHVHKDDILLLSAAVEMIHTYSLIHDDLPAMDDDDMRRGKLTCHKKFDESTAILAGNALLTHGFEILSFWSSQIPCGVRAQIMGQLAQAVGCKGMLSGQMMDLHGVDDENHQAAFHRLHEFKTGKLFEFCAITGALCSQADETYLQALKAYGAHIGLAFQIQDDILDVIGHKEQMGKNVNKDCEKGKQTWIKEMGLEKAISYRDHILSRSISFLDVFDSSEVKSLVNFADYISRRVS